MRILVFGICLILWTSLAQSAPPDSALQDLPIQLTIEPVTDSNFPETITLKIVIKNSTLSPLVLNSAALKTFSWKILYRSGDETTYNGNRRIVGIYPKKLEAYIDEYNKEAKSMTFLLPQKEIELIVPFPKALIPKDVKGVDNIKIRADFRDLILGSLEKDKLIPEKSLFSSIWTTPFTDVTEIVKKLP